jgi:hypothetical protein
MGHVGNELGSQAIDLAQNLDLGRLLRQTGVLYGDTNLVSDGVRS